MIVDKSIGYQFSIEKGFDILKHLAGEHDQQSHGDGGGGNPRQSFFIGPASDRKEREIIASAVSQIREWDGLRKEVATEAIRRIKDFPQKSYGVILQDNDGKIKGVAEFSYPDGATLKLNDLATHESGWGIKMMVEVAKQAVANDRYMVELIALPEANGFYKRLGMAEKKVGVMNMYRFPTRKRIQDFIDRYEEKSIVSEPSDGVFVSSKWERQRGKW